MNIDTLRDDNLTKLQNKFDKTILAMVALEHQQQLFNLASKLEREIM